MTTSSTSRGTNRILRTVPTPKRNVVVDLRVRVLTGVGLLLDSLTCRWFGAQPTPNELALFSTIAKE